MKRLSTLLSAVLWGSSFASMAQSPDILPANPTPAEWTQMLQDAPLNPVLQQSNKNNELYPDMVVPGEFEESQAVMITWAQWNDLHKLQCEFINAIQQEATAWIVVDNAKDSNQVKAKMIQNGFTLTNYKFWPKSNNAFWIRDYGPITFYHDGLDKLGMIDLQYYSTRPLDDAVPAYIAQQMNIPVVNTTMFFEGGNYMTDGYGNSFYSTRLQENNDWLNSPSWTSQTVSDTISYLFNTPNNHAPTTLQCDGGTGHIDIYLKLLDEQTLLVAEYGEVVTAQDRNIIEDNLVYLESLTSTYDRPYKIRRINLPTFDNGQPITSCNQMNNDIRGFVNGLFVNKTFIFPAFSDGISNGNVAADQEAQNILEEALPGYNVVPIDARNLTPLAGALHCITMQIPVENPTRFWHPPVEGWHPLQPTYKLDALIENKSGIQNATCKWRKKGTTVWTNATLTFNGGSGHFDGSIANSGFTQADTIEYFIEANSNNGKYATKPITAPDGFYEFWFNAPNRTDEYADRLDKPYHLFGPYPNPATENIQLPYFTKDAVNAEITIRDLTGRVVKTISANTAGKGIHKTQLNVSDLAPGLYFYTLKVEQENVGTRRFIVK